MNVIADIDECKDKKGGCTHNCTNTEGEYECSCIEGFELEEDGHGCSGKGSLNKKMFYLHSTNRKHILWRGHNNKNVLIHIKKVHMGVEI